MKYSRFAAMIITSTIAMFVMMYLNTYAVSHIWFSETRIYMALYMGAACTVTRSSTWLFFYWRQYCLPYVFILFALKAQFLTLLT